MTSIHVVAEKIIPFQQIFKEILTNLRYQSMANISKSNSNLIVMIATGELWGHAIVGTPCDTFTHYEISLSASHHSHAFREKRKIRSKQCFLTFSLPFLDKNVKENVLFLLRTHAVFIKCLSE